jgi:beta-lactamase class A
LREIASDFRGTVGIAVAPADCPWIAGHNPDSYFPQQSVSKLWVSIAVLDLVDRGLARLDDEVRIDRADLTVLNQPIRQEVLAQGTLVRSLRRLLREAISLSDNTANDQLLQRAGGPAAVRQFLQRKGITGVRFGPGERLLQSSIAGLAWRPDLSLGPNFYRARAALPDPVRRSALNTYLANPVDGAKPAGIARGLKALATGQLLSAASTRHLLQELAHSRSGPMRLKAGVPSGWTVSHKTGTGQELGRRATGYNDVGLLRSPGGRYYAVAVMISETSEPILARMRLMQAVSRTVARFDRQRSEF